ncbi:MAG: hypothetical protein LBU32_10135 [Clostridiales bacterium]|jgi:hypothetical protein|nr:hypothetical protein [Clostridiales bacterium]
MSVAMANSLDTNIWVEDNDVIENIRVWEMGIFMPLKHNDENSAYSYSGKQIDKRDLAEYSFLYGSRYAFRETDNGLLFDIGVYESIDYVISLEEIELYITEMIK